MAKTFEYSLTGYFKDAGVNEIAVLNAATQTITIPGSYKKTTYVIAAGATESISFDDIVNAKVIILVVRDGKVNAIINAGAEVIPCATVLLLTGDADSGYITSLTVTEAMDATATATVDVYIGG